MIWGTRDQTITKETMLIEIMVAIMVAVIVNIKQKGTEELEVSSIAFDAMGRDILVESVLLL